MNYGVTITKGAQDWQIFQQDNGVCTIKLRGEYRLIHMSFELPLEFSEVSYQKPHLKARIAYESSGESVLSWQPCTVVDEAHWETTLENVPAGGLYRIETYMDYEGWDGLSVTRGDVIHNIGVGDIFVIAGQSNAAGRGKTPIEDIPELGVHLLRGSGKWDLATHPLADCTNSIYLDNFANHNPGHTPFLHFAKLLKRELGYPIGLIMTAYGGAPLRWWNPDENGTLYKNMMQILTDNTILPKGILWYQGEAEGFEDAATTYLDRFTSLVNHTREYLQSPSLPFITVQLNRCVSDIVTPELDKQWGIVRESQRKAAKVIPYTYVIPSNDLSLFDFIHTSSEGDMVLGERFAKTALAAIYGKPYFYQAPEATMAVRLGDDKVKIEIANIKNWINPYDVFPALLPINAEDSDGLVVPKAYTLLDNAIEITFARSLATDAVVHGVWKMNCGTAIFDCMRMPMLSFYGMKIE